MQTPLLYTSSISRFAFNGQPAVTFGGQRVSDEALQALEPLLTPLRRLVNEQPSVKLKEKPSTAKGVQNPEKSGTFYWKSKPFLHFHSCGDSFTVAHVKFNTEKEYPVNTPEEQQALLTAISNTLLPGQPPLKLDKQA
jgi:hypothetical protein